MANWGRRGETRNPLDVLIEREGRTCKGCRWLTVERLFGKDEKFCEKRRRPEGRCSQFREME